ncbi:MAG: beta-glucosidase BglX [Bacteroidota bacterium]
MAQQKAAKAPLKSGTASAVVAPAKTGASKSIDQKVDSVLALMTLEEKIGQLTILTSDQDVTGPFVRPEYKKDIMAGKVGSIFNALKVDYVRSLQEMVMTKTRMKIPLIFGYDVIHGYRTTFPIPLAEACSWDLAAIERSARVAGTEAAAEGLDWTFAPMVDIARDPRWGRVMEGAGEDTYLGCLIAEARVKGFQGKSLKDPLSVMACTKHYAAYGAAQAGRDYSTTDITERVLRDVYLPPFEATVKAGVGTFMSAFNDIDGTPATANKWLLDGILRKEWGFKGFVVTDYTAVTEMLEHGNVADSADAAKKAIIAGADMEMQSNVYNAKLPALVKSGEVPVSDIDASARRILRKKFELGLFEDPYRRCNKQRENTLVLTNENLEASRDMARKSMVLLKNENNVLPLSKTVSKVALIGPLAASQVDMLGGWSAQGDGKKVTSLLTALKAEIGDSKVTYAMGCKIDSTDQNGFAEAVAAAKAADVVILALGESKDMSGEACSRASIKLPGQQEALIAELRKTGKPIVLVLFNGRPLDITAVVPNATSVLEAWFPGTMAGPAVCDVLFGRYNPAGKLVMTFPYSVGQVPVFYNQKHTGRPFDAKNHYTSKYLDIPNEPLFPFGYGLSYTTFDISAPKLSSTAVNFKEELTVTVSVKNTGRFEGEEIVQLYVQDLVGSITRPVKELKGYKKIKLSPGAAQEVSFKISSEDLKFHDNKMNFTAEKGGFKVYVGNSSANVKEARFELK